MLRALLRWIPRFGFVTLFALMLLFVSAAGSLKFHVDLWREEEALFADLSKAGVEYAYARHSGDVGQSQSLAGAPMPPPKLWDPLVPYFSRIDHLNLGRSAPRELLERAAGLPYVRSVFGGALPTGPPPTETIVEKAGFELDALPSSDMASEVPALPTGERVEGDAAEALRQNLVTSFESRKPAPTRGTACLAGSPATSFRFYACGDGALFVAYDGGFEITTNRARETYKYEGDVACQNGRLDDPEMATDILTNQNELPVVVQPRPDLEYNLESIGIVSKFQETIREPATIDVARIDDNRVRFDLPPIGADYPAVDCRDVYSISLIARTDLDWELEAWDVVGQRETGPKAPANLAPVCAASFRGTLRREEGWIVVEGWVEDTLIISSRIADRAPAGHPPKTLANRSVGAARFDLSPGLDLTQLAPERFDAKRLPPRRELPWLPWHRATFVLSLGLLGFVGVRRFWKRRAAAVSSNA